MILQTKKDIHDYVCDTLEQLNQSRSQSDWYNEVHFYLNTEKDKGIVLSISFYSAWRGSYSRDNIAKSLDNEIYLNYIKEAQVISSPNLQQLRHREEIKFAIEFDPVDGVDFLENKKPVDFSALKNYVTTNKKDAYLYATSAYGSDKLFEKEGFIVRHSAVDYPYYTKDGFILSTKNFWRHDRFTLLYNKAKVRSFIQSDKKLKLSTVTLFVQNVSEFFRDLINVPGLNPYYGSSPSGETALEDFKKAVSKLKYFEQERRILEKLIVDRYDREAYKFIDKFDSLVDSARNIAWREEGYFEKIKNVAILQEVRSILK